jgi:hypothetical protein
MAKQACIRLRMALVGVLGPFLQVSEKPPTRERSYHAGRRGGTGAGPLQPSRATLHAASYRAGLLQFPRLAWLCVLPAVLVAASRRWFGPAYQRVLQRARALVQAWLAASNCCLFKPLL